MEKIYYHHFHKLAIESREHKYQLQVNKVRLSPEKDSEGNNLLAKPSAKEVDKAFQERVLSRFKSIELQELRLFLDYHYEWYEKVHPGEAEDFLTHTDALIKGYLYRNEILDHPAEDLVAKWIEKKRNAPSGPPARSNNTKVLIYYDYMVTANQNDANHVYQITSPVIDEEDPADDLTREMLFTFLGTNRPSDFGDFMNALTEISDFLDYQLEHHKSKGGKPLTFINYLELTLGVFVGKLTQKKAHPGYEVIKEWLNNAKAELQKPIEALESDGNYISFRYKKPKEKSRFTAGQIALLIDYCKQSQLIARLSKSALSHFFSGLTGVSHNTIYGRDGGGLRDTREIKTKENLEIVKESLLKIIQDIQSDLDKL